MILKCVYGVIREPYFIVVVITASAVAVPTTSKNHAAFP